MKAHFYRPLEFLTFQAVSIHIHPRAHKQIVTLYLFCPAQLRPIYPLGGGYILSMFVAIMLAYSILVILNNTPYPLVSLTSSAYAI